ncbi:hyccin-like [Limulus polyphemus]|uniref:Hyccin-like n=1 Tax=Limulus polyphemus TaxID=6850 RepID=A0ABM1RYK5_LIMPO|nr:hyccin-like [Limulus polyphemus]XP_022236460.1 hyccin-like [Limulus polyphemus]
MTLLLKVYNHHISLMPRLSHLSLCKMISKLVKQGFQRLVDKQRSSFGSEGGNSFNPYPGSSTRVPLSASFLLELLYSLYFCIHTFKHEHTPDLPSEFNKIASVGIQALDDINFRASHELLPEVLLVTNAIKNSLKVNPSGQPKNDSIEINDALSLSLNQST